MFGETVLKIYCSYLGYLISVLRNTKSKENEVTVLDLRNLQGFLSANSWNPESIMENDREVQLNFMLFLPDVLFNNPGIGKTENHRVLIRSENGDLDNNFLIPRWGGICIYDMKEHFRVKEEKKSTVDSIDSHTMDGNVNVSYDRLNTSRAPKQKEERMRLTLQSSDLEVYMRMFAGHLQHLMGIDFSEKKFKESETLWLRYHIDQTFETLGAISNLVASMTHMTVLKRVVDRVETSLDLLEQYMDVISMIDDINTNISFTEKELQNVRLAYQYAEEAFYDPTLIPQLYFPIDQLAATLAPLILPLIPPICMNFMREFKRYRNKIKVKSRNEKEKMN
uniref:Uncharacterized protein n=1 Tax=Aplanochytrium stocchinoi TaxID=215587 RepID=A0A7S3PHS9_9STRA